MSTKELIAAELARRDIGSRDYLSYCFAEQRKFIEDSANFKAAFTWRRAGKSTAIGV